MIGGLLTNFELSGVYGVLFLMGVIACLSVVLYIAYHEFWKDR